MALRKSRLSRRRRLSSHKRRRPNRKTASPNRKTASPNRKTASLFRKTASLMVRRPQKRGRKPLTNPKNARARFSVFLKKFSKGKKKVTSFALPKRRSYIRIRNGKTRLVRERAFGKDLFKFESERAISKSKAKRITSQFIYWDNIRLLAESKQISIADARKLYRLTKEKFGHSGLFYLYQRYNLSPKFNR